jgi:hypothetical protein
MPNLKITELTELAEAPANTDIIPVVDVSTSTTKKITVSNFLNANTLQGLYIVGTTGSGGDYEVDGVADEVQINLAMTAANAAGGGTVYLLAGEYIISDILQIPSKVKLIGSGIDVTTIKAVASFTPTISVYGTPNYRVMLIGSGSGVISNNEVADITWNLNVQNNAGLTSNGSHRHIWIETATNFKLHDNKFINGINWTMYFNLCSQIFIERNIVLGGYDSIYNQNDGIHIRNTLGFSVKSNYVDTTYGGGTSGDDGIVVGTRTGSTMDMAYGDISGNVIAGSGSRGIIVHLEGAKNIHDLVIANNTIANTKHAGIKLYTENSQTGRIYGVTIANNSLYNIGTNGSDGGNFIRLDQDYGISRDLYENVVISGNNLRTQNAASTTWYAIDILGRGNDITITGNSIDGVAGTGGIKVGGSTNAVNSLVLTGNKINVENAASSAKGIKLYAVTNSTITNNNIIGHTTGTTYGIHIEGDGTNNSTGNDVSHNYISSFDNGVAEINSGAAPNSNQYLANFFNTVTTRYTLTGAQSRVIDEDGSNWAFNGTLTPYTSDGAALGTSTLMFSDLFLASGSVVNWNNGDITLTHAANNLLFAGASSGYTFDAKLYPTSNDGAPLGDTTHNFSDLFLASGSVIDWNNGDLILTHAANLLSLTGGNMAIPALAVGNTAPGATLDVLGDASNIYVGNTYLMDTTAVAAGNGARIALGGKYTGSTTQAYGTVAGLKLNATDNNASGYLAFSTRANGGTMDERVRMTEVGNVKIAGTALRGTTEGTNHLDIFNGTAPVGTLTNGISIYSSAGEGYMMDAAGNATLQTPHNSKTNEWIFRSKYTPTGKVLKIDMERLMRKLNDMFGGGFIHEYIEKE